jgi:hypothetical protein
VLRWHKIDSLDAKSRDERRNEGFLLLGRFFAHATAQVTELARGRRHDSLHDS